MFRGILKKVKTFVDNLKNQCGLFYLFNPQLLFCNNLFKW